MPRIILVRHGQASFGAAEYDNLSEKGTAQAEHLGRVLRDLGVKIDNLWFGTMQRHRQTAVALMQGGRFTPEQRCYAGFDEFDHKQVIARYEPQYAEHDVMMRDLAKKARPKEAFAAMFVSALARWYGGTVDDDYDEPWPRFQSRCNAALDHLVAESGQGETHLVVTSGGVISVIAQALLGLSNAATMQVNWGLVNASMTNIHASDSNRRLVSLNEHSHFSGIHHQLLTWA